MANPQKSRRERGSTAVPVSLQARGKGNPKKSAAARKENKGMGDFSRKAVDVLAPRSIRKLAKRKKTA